MTASDTPRTDAAVVQDRIYRNVTATAVLARTLERENAELREALATLETATRRYANGLDSSSAYPLKLCDKARAALAKVRT